MRHTLTRQGIRIMLDHSRSILSVVALAMLTAGGGCLALGQSEGVVSTKPDVPDEPGADSGGGDDGSGSGSGGDSGSGSGDSWSGGDGQGDGSGGGSDGEGDGTVSDSDFKYYFSVTTKPWERNRGMDWPSMLEFDENVLTRDFVILYQHLTGNYPKAGPHLTMREGYTEAHLRQLEQDMDWHIPDPEFSGVAILDYEVFRVDWARTPEKESDLGPDALDYDMKQDWRDYIISVNAEFESWNEERQEEHLRDTYEAASRDFFLATLDKCRELRPNAKWGFYGYPTRFFKNRKFAPRNVISYGDGSHAGSRMNDRLQWMWDAVDVLSPSIYSPRVIVGPDEEVCQDQCSAADFELFVKHMLDETRRLAGDKPVLPFIGMNYNTPRDCLRDERINDMNLDALVFGVERYGADGAILWGGIDNREDMEEWQWMLDNRIMPRMTEAYYDRHGDDGSSSARSDDSDDNGRNLGRVGAQGGPDDDGSSHSAGRSANGASHSAAASITFRPGEDRISVPRMSREEIRRARERAERLGGSNK